MIVGEKLVGKVGLDHTLCSTHFENVAHWDSCTPASNVNSMSFTTFQAVELFSKIKLWCFLTLMSWVDHRARWEILVWSVLQSLSLTLAPGTCLLEPIIQEVYGRVAAVLGMKGVDGYRKECGRSNGWCNLMRFTQCQLLGAWRISMDSQHAVGASGLKRQCLFLFERGNIEEDCL